MIDFIQVSLRKKFQAFLWYALSEMKYVQLFKYSFVGLLLSGIFIFSLSGVSIYKVYHEHMFRNAEAVASSIREAVVDQEWRALFAVNADGDVHLQIDKSKYSDFDRRLRNFLKPFQIVKIKVFSLQREIIYSTDQTIIGKVIKQNERLEKALIGDIVSRLEAGAELKDLEGERRIDIDVIETYLPVEGKNGKIAGCFELYADVTPYRQEFKKMFYMSMGTLFLVLVLVFGVLILLLRHVLRAMFSNFNELRETQGRLAQMAFYDCLTGLPNRNLVKDRFQQLQAQAVRHKKIVAVFSMDLDHFKQINDSQGHLAGDQFLVKVSERLKSFIRKEDTIGRLGGDEFVVLLGNLEHEEEAVKLARKIVDSMRFPFDINGKEVYSGLSVGISFFPNHGAELETVFKHADMALYRAKEVRGGYEIFTLTMNDKVLHKMNLQQNLRKAIENDELFLLYQPKVDLATGNIDGVEALVRWHRPNGEIIPPDQFIPIAEESNLIHLLGEWVLYSACRQIRAWSMSSGFPLKVAINVSSRQFERSDLMKTATKALAETGADPRLLEFEITETTLMQDAQRVVNTLLAFKAMGIQSSIDDFGTGYSSLGYISHLPVESLKIDKTFVKNFHDKSGRAIILAIIALCKDLGLKTIAEGVETKAQHDFLRENGCDQYQGFWFSRPVLADEIDKLVQEMNLLGGQKSGLFLKQSRKVIGSMMS